MTSRFGKTYSRKAGDSASKFDEVLSTKRGTLSTKWGDTKYKAKVASKRGGGPKSEAGPDVFKRRRTGGGGVGEDPFGFDSDEESKPVTSRVKTPEKSERQTGYEAVGSSSWDSIIGTTHTTATTLLSFVRVKYSEKDFINICFCVFALVAAGKPAEPPLTYSWYQNASESDRKPLAQTTTLKTGYKPDSASSPALDQWDTINHDFPAESSDYSDYSSTLVRSAVCRTYRRPIKSKDSDDAGFDALKSSESKPAPARSRTRDFTVLHPSSMSACNVTIQERATEAPPSAGSTGQSGEAAWRKKAEHGSRFGTSQKESKSDLFGFDEDPAQAQNSADPSGFKTKYFGFDDMSDSDGEEDGARERQKTKRKMRPNLEEEETPEEVQDEGLNHTCVFSSWITSVSSQSSVPGSGSSSSSSSSAGSAPSDSQSKDDGLFKAPPPPPKVSKCVRVPSDPCQETVTALRCHKEHKELYTVVQHVKHFNDVVEFGENQEFTDDFEYLSMSETYCLVCSSVISLATRCAMPSFRMHLRARGKVAQVFKTLNDAPQHQNLSLCTAALMYILSRDRLNMDLDRSCLDLMIRLLELDLEQSAADAVQLSAREIAKIKEKIRKLCDTVHNKHLDLQNINTGHLAMETLLSLTSKRAGDWFKEELRLLGGLDHIVDKVKECAEQLTQQEDEEKLGSSLWGRTPNRKHLMFSPVTVHNPENQSYLIAYKDSSLIVSSAKALWKCEQMIQTYTRDLPSDRALAKAVQDCMRAIIGVLLNLTHDNEWGSTKTGEQDDLMTTALNCVLKVPQFLPQEQRFDVRVLGLGLLINLVEYSARNRYALMEMDLEVGPCETTVIQGPNHVQDQGRTGTMSAIAALVQLFLQRERAAVLAEAQTDDLIKEPPKPADQSGEWQETGGEIQWVANDNHNNNAATEKDKKKPEEEEHELDLNKALQHAGKHMEDSIVASYTALLLGCLCQGSPMNVTTVRENLPKGDFSIMTEMLKKFLNFMNLTCDVGTTGQKSISRIIDYLEHC
uniref:WAPL cohesin release factor b n=1 Tax=Neogobius melanostomus TaxID=47308 RepID=A0A8C6UDV3_9GOBI